MSPRDLLPYLGYFGAAGLAGWMLENALSPAKEPRYSAAFGGLKVPFLPVYGVGGVVVGALGRSEAVGRQPLLVRTALYGAALTAVEWTTCTTERALSDHRSWGYAGGACIDLPHTLAWAALGLAMEQAVVLPTSPTRKP